MLKFKPIYRVALNRSYRKGLLTKEEYDTAIEPLRWPIRRHKTTGDRVYILDAVRDHVYQGMQQEGIGLDWNNIIQWIKDNWVTILKLIITLLVFLDPPPQAR